jgi:hypothetical protein
MIIAWAFIIMSWSGGHHLLQAGPFVDQAQCDKVRQMAVAQFDLAMGLEVVITDCFKVVLR